MQREKNSKKMSMENTHSNKLSLKNDNTILNLPVIDSYGVPAAGLQCITGKSNKDILQKN